MVRRPIPLSIKIIATLFALDAGLRLASIQRGETLILGFAAHGAAAAGYSLTYAVTLIYIGGGLWAMRETVRRVGIGMQIYRIIEQFTLLGFMFANWNPSASKYPPAVAIATLSLICLVPAALQAVILALLIKKRASFQPVQSIQSAA